MTPAATYRTIVADPPWEIGEFPANFGYEAGKRTPYSMMPLAEIVALPVASLAAPEAHLYLWTTSGYLRDAYGVAEAWGFEPMYPLVWCKPPYGEGLGGKYVSNVEFVLFCRERHGSVAITNYLADAAARAGFTARDLNRAMGTSDMAGWWLSRLPHRSRIPTTAQWAQLKTLLGLDDRYDDDVQAVNDNRNDGLRCPTRWWEWPRGRHSEKPEAFLDIVESVSPAPRLEMFARRQRLGWDTWGNEALGHVEMAS
jgi:N6-adenosine-specific RNA methylase IME4